MLQFISTDELIGSIRDDLIDFYELNDEDKFILILKMKFLCNILESDDEK